MRNESPTPKQMADIVAMGYAVNATNDDDHPAIRCATTEGDIYSAPSWAAVAHYASSYELCACGVHEQAFNERD